MGRNSTTTPSTTTPSKMDTIADTWWFLNTRKLASQPQASLPSRSAKDKTERRKAAQYWSVPLWLAYSTRNRGGMKKPEAAKMAKAMYSSSSGLWIIEHWKGAFLDVGSTMREAVWENALGLRGLIRAPHTKRLSWIEHQWYTELLAMSMSQRATGKKGWRPQHTCTRLRWKGNRTAVFEVISDHDVSWHPAVGYTKLCFVLWVALHHSALLGLRPSLDWLPWQV